jgi:hypothetical protein
MSQITYDDSGNPSQDEETPLLSAEPVTKDVVTPVPWAQLWVLLVLQLAEPLTSQVIYPFAPEVRLLLSIHHHFSHGTVCPQCGDHAWR